EVVSVGDVIDVKVVSIDLERGRIGLSMIIEK
ncbi:MAG TPA: S1 RNA-binding domain-containing protein, partial [Caldithrix abyssi]|nr:S1 RNA-binding domain-containing protein [Caldithrix abyssi]